jgi:iron complex outermembrane receptor protein
VLYGRGDPGGLINIVTKQPRFSPAAGFTLQAGGDQFWRGEADLTGPIVDDKLAARLTAAAQTSDTFRDVFEPSTRQFISPSLLWTPSDRTRVSTSAAFTHQETQSDRGVVAAPKAGGGYTIDLPYDRFLGEAFATLESRKLEANYRVEHEASDWLTLRQVGHYDEGKIDLFGINQRGVTVNANTGVRLSSRQATEQHETNHNYDFQLDAVARFKTGSIGHTVVLGGEYAKAYRHLLFYRASLASIDIDNPVYGAKPGTFALANDRTVDADIWAAYLQDQIDLTRTVKLLAGVRFDHAKQSNAAVGAISSADDKKLSPRVGVVWEVAPAVSLFADYTRSFQPNLGITVSGAPIAAESGAQYEAGVKADLLDKRLSMTASVFQLKRAHVAAADPNASSSQLDVGDQRSRGVELDVAGTVSPTVKVVANGAYMKTEITRSADVASFTPGNILANAPKWSGGLWATWEPDGALKGFGFGSGVFAASNRQGDLANSFAIGGYTRIDASVWRDLGEHLRVTVSAKNLLDDRYIDSAVSTNEIYPAAGRTWMVGLSGRF